MRTLIFIIALFAVLLSGCFPMMHKTIAEQVVRVDKNCDVLLVNYKLALTSEARPTDLEHEIALIDATLLLLDNMRKSADMVLEDKK